MQSGRKSLAEFEISQISFPLSVLTLYTGRVLDTMFWTSIARSVPPTNISHSLQKLLPKTLPPSLQNNPGNLYQVLSRTPSGGVGKRVYQLRWSEKGIEDCYWIVTQSKFKCEGKHGKAWGKLVWRGACLCRMIDCQAVLIICTGKEVSEKPERIRGSLKYKWAEGVSKSSEPQVRSTCELDLTFTDCSPAFITLGTFTFVMSSRGI